MKKNFLTLALIACFISNSYSSSHKSGPKIVRLADLTDEDLIDLTPADFSKLIVLTAPYDISPELIEVPSSPSTTKLLTTATSTTNTSDFTSVSATTGGLISATPAISSALLSNMITSPSSNSSPDRSPSNSSKTPTRESSSHDKGSAFSPISRLRSVSAKLRAL